MALSRLITTVTVKTANKLDRIVNVDVQIEARTRVEAIKRLRSATDIYLELEDGRHEITFGLLT